MGGLLLHSSSEIVYEPIGTKRKSITSEFLNGISMQSMELFVENQETKLSKTWNYKLPVQIKNNLC